MFCTWPKAQIKIPKFQIALFRGGGGGGGGGVWPGDEANLAAAGPMFEWPLAKIMIHYRLVSVGFSQTSAGFG